MAIDLSKLKALELPKKEIEIDILGEKQKITVQAVDDKTAIKIASIGNATNIPDEERELKIRGLVLKSGVPGISDEEIELLMEKGAAVVTQICAEVSELSKEFNEARSLEKKEAEKNSEAAPGQNMKA